MHKAASDYCEHYRNNDEITVVEIGSRNINGTIRGKWPMAKWTGLDLYPGVDVDVVADAIIWRPPEPVDLVVCCEVLEHAPQWELLIKAASEMLKDGGHLIMTCAGPGRKPHSHHDGKALRPGEYYQNLSTRQIGRALYLANMATIHIAQNGSDTQCCAVKMTPPIVAAVVDGSIECCGPILASTECVVHPSDVVEFTTTDTMVSTEEVKQ